MGKKIKTLDHILPDDVFEKVLLESHQVATVVLMLDSPEDDVVIKAGCSIFQFSEKCDENKLVLLETNVLDKLLRLIQNDECKIRRITSMAIGSMSQHPDARKSLRRREETIPLLIRLLLWEDDVVVQEDVTLCLASLAIDYSSKSNLCSYGAMEPLVHCLQSPDADVQKNSIQTIALMLQDYPCHQCLLTANGLPVVVDLIKSEYPVVQFYALQSLQLAAENDEVRSALKDMKIARILLDFLSRPEASELSVFAVMALNPCLANDGILQAFRDYGGLQRLVTLITDVQLTPDEEKKSKKEKGTSKASGGKKSRADDDGDEKQRSKGGGGAVAGGEWGAADPPLAVIPDIKEHVAKALALAATNPDCRRLLHEQEAEKRLIALLASDRGPAIQTSAALALGTMAACPVVRDTILKCDGMDALGKLINKTDNADLLESVSLAFSNLTVDCTSIAGDLLKKGTIDQLLSMLTKPREKTIVCATIALSNLAADEMLRTEAGRKVIPALAELLRSKSSLVHANALMALSFYILDSEAQKQLMEIKNFVELLLSLFESGDESVTESASWLIYIIATSNVAAAAYINTKGGLSILQGVQQSSTRRNSYSELALQKLFDAHLTAKYGFTGILGPDDLIQDDFFDVGRLSDSDVLKTIEEYGGEDLNDKRPIILVNPKTQGPVIEVTETPVVEKTITMPLKAPGGATGPGSPAGANPPSSTPKAGKGKRAQKEKEEKQREEEMLLQLQQQQQLLLQKLKEEEAAGAGKEPYIVPGDNQLIQYISEAQELITPLPDTREQIKALAKFVSDKMGGAMDDDERTAKSDAEVTQLKKELTSNVIPIGKIRTGIHYHRALLFKVLADRVGLACSLVRGDYGRAWNVVTLTADNEAVRLGYLTQQMRPFIVDVMSQPGRLLSLDSCDAVAYQGLSSLLPRSWNAQSPLQI